MVNVPPIPPLLCSTPPPIDFGEDDEDVDVIVPTVDGVTDDDFGDFLNLDDRKNSEPLHSTQTHSVYDLPPFSIYDGLIKSDDEEGITKATTSPPPTVDYHIGREIKNDTKSTHIAEAFNFNIKNTNDDNKKNTSVHNKDPPFESKEQAVEPNVSSKEATNQTRIETNSDYMIEDSEQKIQPNSQGSVSQNVKDLTVEAINKKSESTDTSETNMKCIQSVVSIEDIEDDLSDDELYSPKTQKNFMERDCLNDYFTIQQIEPIRSESKMVSKTKSFDSLDNNESASFKNENDLEFKSFSSNAYSTQDFFDMPPPLDEDTKSINDNDNGDEFGNFADFQDFSEASTPPESQNFVNNNVPVKDINNKQHSKNDVKIHVFNEFIDYNNATNESYNVNENDFYGFKASAEDDKDEFEFSSHISITTDKHENKSDIVNYISNDNFRETKETDKVDSFGDFNAAPKEEVHKNVDFSTEKYKTIATDSNKNTLEISSVISNPDPDDEFGDFADFESHQEVTIPEKTSCNENAYSQPIITHEKEHGSNDEEDDDFGDFNTAQPLTATSSNLAQSTTSQLYTTATHLPQNLDERISKILHVMFSPPSGNFVDHEDTTPKTSKIQDIPFTSIDAAKALEYQWLNSDTRHSFIKSLGIDSRNILFGENWNPSLPRFAANLSFNPLKPMKPVPCGNTAVDSIRTLEPTTIEPIESNKALDAAGSTNNNNLEINSISLYTVEQEIEAHKDNNSTKMPCVSNEPSLTEPVSLTIFENPLENEKTLSKTPPICEMESVSTFSSPSPSSNRMNMESNNITNYELKEVEENFDNTLNINEVIVTSTFTGSFKETHIYTPSKTNDFDTTTIGTATASSTSSSSPSKASPIDFDYEKAAMGVIINETVVKKEYRDVEYNPPFSMEYLNKVANMANTELIYDTNVYANNANVLANTNDIKMSAVATEDDVNDENSDDFTEFQSVSSEVMLPALTVAADVAVNQSTVAKAKPTTVAHGGMILSPAILIPQAISMENQKPKIEWGDSTASINPEELARIEELFPEPKSLKSSNASSSSQKSTPTHQVACTPSISATVANKELERSINHTGDDDDDDWCDFVSVSVANNTSVINRSTSNNNIMTKSPAGSPFKPRSPVVNHKTSSSNTLHSNSNNDEEWSDFVSSVPPSIQPAPSTSYRVPQFNSGAWQNANFYNNPLSMYHKGPLNISATVTKSLYNNNNNYNTISQQPYQIANNLPPPVAAQQMPTNMYHQNQQQQHQQIHVMQNFSTAPVPTPERLTAAAVAAKNNQFQVGSAKVAPSIALIPDLGFVAPAIPTHTSFINSLPKPSISSKK